MYVKLHPQTTYVLRTITILLRTVGETRTHMQVWKPMTENDTLMKENERFVIKYEK